LIISILHKIPIIENTIEASLKRKLIFCKKINKITIHSPKTALFSPICMVFGKDFARELIQIDLASGSRKGWKPFVFPSNP